MPKHAAIRKAKPITPHDRRQPLNRAPAPSWVANFREQIKVKAIISRLQTFGLSDPDNPTSPRLTRTQAQVLLALLRKQLPDMQAIEVTGAGGAAIQVQVLQFTLDEPAEPPKPLITIDNEVDAMIARMPPVIEDEPAPSPGRTTRRKRSQ